MTREEQEKAINNLKILKEEYWEDDGYGHETENYKEMMWSLDMAIESLEQKPVLDKMKTDIGALEYLNIGADIEALEYLNKKSEE